MTRVLIVDDYEIIKKCLCGFSEGETKVKIIEYDENSDEIVANALHDNPDLIIMCVNLYANTFYDTIRMIKMHNEKNRVWIITLDENRTIMENALKCGVDGYLLHDKENSHIPMLLADKYIRSNGAKDITNTRRHRIDTSKRLKNEENHWKAHFTAREKEVLKLVVEGMTNHEIADCLGISAGRARNIVTELIMKCMVKNRTQLAVFAVNRGIVSIEYDEGIKVTYRNRSVKRRK